MLSLLFHWSRLFQFVMQVLGILTHVQFFSFHFIPLHCLKQYILVSHYMLTVSFCFHISLKQYLPAFNGNRKQFGPRRRFPNYRVSMDQYTPIMGNDPGADPSSLTNTEFQTFRFKVQTFDLLLFFVHTCFIQ